LRRTRREEKGAHSLCFESNEWKRVRGNGGRTKRVRSFTAPFARTPPQQISRPYPTNRYLSFPLLLLPSKFNLVSLKPTFFIWVAEKAKKDAIRKTERVSDLLVEAVNGGVQESFINQKRIELEIRALAATIARFMKQTDQWLATTHALNTALKVPLLTFLHSSFLTSINVLLLAEIRDRYYLNLLLSLLLAIRVLIYVSATIRVLESLKTSTMPM